MKTVMVHATGAELGRIIDAAMRVSLTCGDALITTAEPSTGSGFTCDEAEAIAALLDATGSPHAESFRDAHARSDDEDDRHHGGWVTP